MNYPDFFIACKNLKHFLKEQDKLDAVLKVLSPTGTCICEFGNRFIDDYIWVVELALDNEDNWFSWFVFENNFGKNKMKAEIEGKKYTISNEREFFDIICMLKKQKK